MAEAPQTPNPAEAAPEYNKLSDTWKMIRALMAGTKAIRDGGEAFLPRFPEEKTDNHANRLKKAVLFDAYRQTIRDMVGLPFAKPVTRSEDIPPSISDLLDDIDLEGTSLDVFARNAFEEGLGLGSVGVLVDRAPAASDPESVAEARKRRPYWLLLKPENILDARVGLVDERLRYTYLRFREDKTVFDGFKEKTLQRVREIVPPEWRLWQKGENGWSVLESGRYDMPFVTLSLFRSGRDDERGRFTAHPPLENLAFQNIAHLQSDSDQQNILSFSRFAILVISGEVVGAGDDGDGKLSIGPQTIIQVKEGGSADIKEHTGKAIEAGERDLQRRKEEMSIAGTQLLVKHKGPQRTATEDMIDTIEEQSELEAIVIEFTGALNLAKQYTADWLGIPDAGDFKVNSEFGIAFNVQLRKDTLLKLWEGGGLSLEDTLRELKEAGLLSEDVTVEELVENAASDPTLLGGRTREESPPPDAE